MYFGNISRLKHQPNTFACESFYDFSDGRVAQTIAGTYHTGTVFLPGEYVHVYVAQPSQSNPFHRRRTRKSDL